MFDAASSTQWERQTIQKVLLEHITEQRRARRWGIFFKLVIFAFIIAVLVASFKKDLSQPVMMSQDHTALIDIKGEIGADHNANADNIRASLRSAFNNKHVKGVVLRINSVGGSPVQARQIFDDIQALRIEHPDIRIYAAIEDVGASAGYLIAVAAEAIYSDKTSLVGSIGVRLESFGFVDAMNKVGVERRSLLAGKHKDLLDPFLPRNPDDERFMQKQLEIVHQAFIQNVKEGRGDRLHETPDLYSGLYWCGEEALALGLIDAYGDAYYVAKHIIGAEDVVDYTTGTNLFDRLAHRLGTSMTHVLYSQAGAIFKGLQ